MGADEHTLDAMMQLIKTENQRILRRWRELCVKSFLPKVEVDVGPEKDTMTCRLMFCAPIFRHSRPLIDVSLLGDF